MGFLKTYLQSSEFKRTSRNTADSALKLIFNWGAWAVIGFLALVTELRPLG